MTPVLKSRFSIALLALSCLFLSACGFQLRGAADIAAPLQQLSLISEGSRSELDTPLRRYLKGNGVQLVDTESANYTLEITSESQTRRVATLSASANVDEYELTSRVSFTVSDLHGEEPRIVLERSLSVERTYDYDNNNATASSVQETQLRREMNQQLASQIVRLYAAINPAQ